jgi:glycosyltransferase involved in cell wall biosynthesis
MRVVLDYEFRNWILGGVIQESKDYASEEIYVQYIKTSRSKYPINFLYRRYLKRLKPKENDLVINQKTLLFLIQSGLLDPKALPILRCHFTHESEEFLKKTDLLGHIKNLKSVLVLNESDAGLLKRLGVDPNRIEVIYGAINREIFFPLGNYSQNRKVLITGDAKERKNPSKILEVINANPHTDFQICGKFWEKSINQTNLKYSNVEFHKFSMEKNALLMRNASAYLTLSHKEGGPFPVLEALASGTPVVSTPVGWAPELLDETNGVIVKHDSSIEEIAEAIEKCFELKCHTFSQDLLEGRFTWEELARRLYISEK